MNNTGRITLQLPENCLAFSDCIDSTSIVNTARITEESLHTVITTNDLYNCINAPEFDGTVTLPISTPCDNFGIRITWLKESTENIIHRVLNPIYTFRAPDLLYYCGPTSHQDVIREYLIEKYNFTPNIGFQLLQLNAVDLLQIADRLKHAMPKAPIDRFLLKNIIRIKHIVRRMPQLPDLKAFYWESDKYEVF